MNELIRPRLSTQLGYSAEFASSFTTDYTASYAGPTTAGVLASVPITLPVGLNIGYFPDYASRSHLCLRDLWVALSPDDVIRATGYVEYVDCGGRAHTVVAAPATTIDPAATPTYIVAAPQCLIIPDAALGEPSGRGLGYLRLNLYSLVMGLATVVEVRYRANWALFYEVAR